MTFKKKILVLATAFIFATAGVAVALTPYEDALINGIWTFENDVIFLGDIAADGISLNGVAYTWPAADGTATYQLTTDGAGTLSWAASAAALPWDDIANPDADKAIDFTAYYTSMDFGDDNHDMLTIQGTGDFADHCIVKIEQITGNPTDGTVLYVKSADAQADALVVEASAINSIVVAANGDVTLTGGTGVIDYTDFDVSADGAVTIASDVDNTMVTLNPSIATTLAIDATAANIATALSVGANDILGTTGLINYTHFDVDAAGAIIGTALDAGAGLIQTTGNLEADDGTFTGNVAITGALAQDALVAATAATTITLNGTGAGGVNIGNIGTGTIALGADGAGATLVSLPNTVDLTMAGGQLSITDTANADLVSLTNNTMTTGDMIEITAAGVMTTGSAIKVTAAGATSSNVISVTADGLTSGSIYYADSVVAGFTGSYFHAFDGAADDFTVKADGITTIAGTAGGAADSLVIGLGCIQVTAGDIDVDDGFIAVNTDEDHASYITRALAAAGSGPAFTVTDSNAATTQPSMTIASGGNACTGALTIDQTGTGNASGIDLNVAGDLPAIDIDASAARDGDVMDIAMANMLAGRAINITGAITGTAGEGVIEIHGTGVIPATASLVRLDADTAQPGDGSGYILNIDDDTLVVATPVHYAVLLDSNANGALHVSKGVSLFADAATFTAASVHNGGITVNEEILVTLDNADEEVTILNSVQYGADDAQVVINNTTAAVGAQMWLLRLRYTDDGEPNADFAVFEDENGTDMIQFNDGGAIVMEGSLTVSGAQIVGDGATEMVGVTKDVVTTGAVANYAVTAAMSGTIFLNSQATIYDLPVDPTGCEFTFVVANASNMQLDPNVNDIISYIGCAAGDKLLSATVGDTISIVGVSATTWYVTAVVGGDGDWTDTVWTDNN